MTLGKFLNEKWAEIVVIGFLGLIAYTIFFDMRDRLTRIEVNNVEAKSRIDKIVDLLPDMRIRVVEELSRRPVQTVIFASNPVQNAEGGWFMNTAVVDSLNGKIARFDVALKNQDDGMAMLALRGAVKAMSQNSYSFNEIEALRIKGIFQNSILDGWQADTSFAYAGNYSDILAKFKKAGWNPNSLADFKGKFYTWDELAKDVNRGVIPLNK